MNIKEKKKKKKHDKICVFKICMLTMSKKKSHNRFQFWKHFDDASDIEVLMKNIMISNFNPARRRRINLWFCKLDLPKKQSYKGIQFWRHFDVASNLIKN